MSALTQVFVRVHFRYDQDPYAADLERFAAWLLAARYVNKTARGHLFHVQQALHRIGAPPGSALTLSSLARGFRVRGRLPSLVYGHTRTTYTGFLRACGRLIEPAPPSVDPVVAVVEIFCKRLTARHGFAPSTVAGYHYWISDFLKRSLAPGRPLTDLSSASLPAYVQARGSEMKRHTFQTALHCIQRFLRECHEQGRLPARIDELDLPRGFRPERPPRALPWPLVGRLLRSVDCRTWVGHRDHTILHLMAHYGLRPGELAHLTLASIDWDASTLCVRQTKTHSTLVLPLHARTVRVLRDYLEHARPHTTLPWIFLRGQAPEAPMTKYSLSLMFKTRARRSGLPIEHYSAYSLRHAFALRLFRQGVGLKAIGDLMGHRSLVSTESYIRLQTDVLREVALQVPRQATRVGGVR